MRQRIGWALVVLAGIYLIVVAFFFTLMKQPPARFASVMAKVPESVFRIVPFRRLWMNARGGRIRVGDMAPDFQLTGVDRKSTVKLSDFKGQKPVVLIFGSYT